MKRLTLIFILLYLFTGVGNMVWADSETQGGTASTHEANWSNIDSVFASDDKRASYNNTTQDKMRIDDFGFSIPTANTIDSMEMYCEGYGTDNKNKAISVSFSIGDYTVYGTTRNILLQWNSDGTTNPIPAPDLWDTTWTATQINSSDFGVLVKDFDVAAAPLNIDYFYVTVWHTAPVISVDTVTCVDTTHSSVKIRAVLSGYGATVDSTILLLDTSNPPTTHADKNVSVTSPDTLEETGLSSSTEYFYKVIGWDGAVADTSAVDSVTTDVLPAPTSPLTTTWYSETFNAASYGYANPDTYSTSTGQYITDWTPNITVISEVDSAHKCQIRVGTSASGSDMEDSIYVFGTGDTTCTDERTPKMQYHGAVLQDGIQYHWSARLITVDDDTTEWSADQTFMGVSPDGWPTYSDLDTSVVNCIDRANLYFGDSHSQINALSTVSFKFKTGQSVSVSSNGLVNQAIDGSLQFAYYEGFLYGIWLSIDTTGEIGCYAAKKDASTDNWQTPVFMYDAGNVHNYGNLIIGEDEKLHIIQGAHMGQFREYVTVGTHDDETGISLTSLDTTQSILEENISVIDTVFQSSDDAGLEHGWAWRYSDAICRFGNYNNPPSYVCDAGVRFDSIDVGKNTLIDSAFIEFTSNAVYSNDDCNLLFYCENIDSSFTFADDSSAFNTRLSSLTDTSVSWDVVGHWLTGSTYKSPNIKAIIQEIVNRENWKSGNALTVFIKDNSSDVSALRGFRSYDYLHAVSPKLKIYYHLRSGATRASYPRLTKTSDGNLFLGYRYYGHVFYDEMAEIENNHYYAFTRNKWNGSSYDGWEREHRILITYKDFISSPCIYNGGFSVDQNDRLYVLVTWHDYYGGPNRTRGLSLFYSDYDTDSSDFIYWQELENPTDTIGQSTINADTSLNAYYAGCSKIIECHYPDSAWRPGPATNIPTIIVDTQGVIISFMLDENPSQTNYARPKAPIVVGVWNENDNLWLLDNLAGVTKFKSTHTGDCDTFWVKVEAGSVAGIKLTYSDNATDTIMIDNILNPYELRDTVNALDTMVIIEYVGIGLPSTFSETVLDSGGTGRSSYLLAQSVIEYPFSWNKVTGAYMIYDGGYLYVYARVRPDSIASGDYFGGEVYEWRCGDIFKNYFSKSWSGKYLTANSSMGCGRSAVISKPDAQIGRQIFTCRGNYIDNMDLNPYYAVMNNGNDVRIVAASCSSGTVEYLELDRCADVFGFDSTTIWWRIPANIVIAANAQTATNVVFQTYFRNPNAYNPKSNPGNVFNYWQSYEEISSGTDLNGYDGWIDSGTVKISTDFDIDTYSGANYGYLWSGQKFVSSYSKGKASRKMGTNLTNRVIHIRNWSHMGCGFLLKNSSGNQIGIGKGINKYAVIWPGPGYSMEQDSLNTHDSGIEMKAIARGSRFISTNACKLDSASVLYEDGEYSKLRMAVYKCSDSSLVDSTALSSQFPVGNDPNWAVLNFINNNYLYKDTAYCMLVTAPYTAAISAYKEYLWQGGMVWQVDIDTGAVWPSSLNSVTVDTHYQVAMKVYGSPCWMNDSTHEINAGVMYDYKLVMNSSGFSGYINDVQIVNNSNKIGIYFDSLLIDMTIGSINGFDAVEMTNYYSNPPEIYIANIHSRVESNRRMKLLKTGGLK